MNSMKIQDLRLLRELVLKGYVAGVVPRDTARNKCREITKAIEKLAAKEESSDGKASRLARL